MSEHREEFLMDIEKRLLELNVQQLHRVCKQCDIAGKDNEAIKDKTRRALVKHVIKFCERDELLQKEDEGMSVLLQLSDVLDALLQEHPAETDDAGAPPVSSSPVITEGREETARRQQPASEGQREDSTPLQPSQELHTEAEIPLTPATMLLPVVSERTSG